MKLFKKFARLLAILLVFLITIHIVQQRQSFKTEAAPRAGLEIYSARFAGVGSYQELASLGVMHPNTLIRSPSEVKSVVDTAKVIRNSYPNFKPSVFLYPWPFTCSGISQAGKDLIEYINNNNYWDDILAINGLHEPLSSSGCSSLAQVQDVVRQVKSLSNGKAKLFDKLYSDTSYGAMGFTDGICDYCAVLYHPYRGNTTGVFQKNTLLSNLERDINLVKSVPPGETLNKFVPWLATIHFPGVYGTGLYMPSPNEMLDGGSSIVNFTSSQGYQVDGLVWYTWDNVNQWIGLNQYNSDGQKAGRMEVIASLAGEAPPISPTPTPTPTPPTCLHFNKGDANCDNKIDELDYVVWWQNYGVGLGADFNGDGFTDELDYVVWWQNYGSSFD